MTGERVYLVDDDPSVRKGLTRLLRSAGYEVEAFGSAAEFMQRPEHEGAACLILDLSMPALSGSALQAQMVDEGSTLPIVFLSGHADIEDSVRAMKLGAIDFFTKPVDEEELLAAVARALAGHRDRLAQERTTRAVQARLDTLTARELETARWLVTGKLNKQIAAELGIAEKTVKIHRARVMEKMSVSSIAELVRLLATVGIGPATREP